MDFLYTFTNWADWFEANILDGLAPFLFSPIQNFLLWSGESQGILQFFITLFGLLTPS